MRVRIDRGITAALTATAVLVLGIALAMADDAPAEWKAPARAARKKNPIAADAASIATGKDVYAKQCLSCHGAAGKGNGPAAVNLQKPPGDLSSQKVADETDGALFWKITEGNKPMPSFEKLCTDDERWNVVNYIRSLGPPSSTPKGGS